MISKARKYLKEINIYDKNKEDFLKYLQNDLLKKTPSFVFLFTYFYYINKQDISFLKELRDKIYQNKNLIKKLPYDIFMYNYEYKLYYDLNRLEKEKIIYKLIKELPSHLKKKYDIQTLKEFIGHNFYDLYKEGFFKDFIVNSSKYKDLKELNNGLINFLDEIKNRKAMDELINDLKKQHPEKLKLVHIDYERKFIVAYCFSAKGINSHGSSMWCIKTKRTFNNYIKSSLGKNEYRNRQFIIFDFDFENKNIWEKIGITLKCKNDFRNIDSTLYACHLLNNTSYPFYYWIKYKDISIEELNYIFPDNIEELDDYYLFYEINEYKKISNKFFNKINKINKTKLIDKFIEKMNKNEYVFITKDFFNCLHENKKKEYVNLKIKNGIELKKYEIYYYN